MSDWPSGRVREDAEWSPWKQRRAAAWNILGAFVFAASVIAIFLMLGVALAETAK